VLTWKSYRSFTPSSVGRMVVHTTFGTSYSFFAMIMSCKQGVCRHKRDARIVPEEALVMGHVNRGPPRETTLTSLREG
jgi:hypothetical protein